MIDRYLIVHVLLIIVCRGEIEAMRKEFATHSQSYRDKLRGPASLESISCASNRLGAYDSTERLHQRVRLVKTGKVTIEAEARG